MTRSAARAPRLITRGWLALLAAVALIAGGCADDGDYPRGWSPLQPPARLSGTPYDSTAPRTCPVVAGLYRTSDTVVFLHFIGRRLTAGQRRIPWYTVELSGSMRDSVRAILAADATRDTVWLARGRDFDCADGWITAEWPTVLLQMWPPDSAEASRGYESRLAITRDVDGRLVGRMTTVSYRRVAMWCGDGCKYAPIPFTRRDYVRWYRLSTERTFDADHGMTREDSIMNARIAHQDSVLEEGGSYPPSDPRGRASAARQRVRDQVRRIEEGDVPPP